MRSEMLVVISVAIVGELKFRTARHRHSVWGFGCRAAPGGGTLLLLPKSSRIEPDNLQTVTTAACGVRKLGT